MRAIAYEGSGGPEVARARELPTPEPGTREVRLNVTYAGLNAADSHQREGMRPPPSASATVGGIEVAGTVEKCGPAATRWKVGDRVFGLVDGGGFADRVVVPEQFITAIPTSLSDELAAAVPENFITAHDALARCGELRPGDRVLVTGANGGVGSAAIQLAIAGGAEAVGTSRSAHGLEFIKSLGAEPLRHDLWLDPSRDVGPFDLIIELVGGPSIPRGIPLLATLGTLVVVGVPMGTEVSISVRPLMSNRASIVGTGLRRRPLEEKATAIAAFAREVVPLLSRGIVRPHIDAVFPHTQADAAFARLDSSGKHGKVLVSFLSSW